MEYKFSDIIRGEMFLDEFCEFLDGEKVVLTADLELGYPDDFARKDRDNILKLVLEGKAGLDKEGIAFLKKGQVGTLVCGTYISPNTHKAALDTCLVIKDDKGEDISVDIPIYETQAEFVEE